MLVTVAALAVFLVLFVGLPEQTPRRVADVSYSEFKQLAADNALSKVTFRGKSVTASLAQAQPIGALGQTAAEVRSRVPDLGDPELLPLLEDKGVEIRSLPSEGEG
ncbi:MAG: hypothetical protein QNI94_18215, partial [Kiloniellales bacterium]|nr:hypothetical protein [Kiloniellales bacterium]